MDGNGWKWMEMSRTTIHFNTFQYISILPIYKDIEI